MQPLNSQVVLMKDEDPTESAGERDEVEELAASFAERLRLGQCPSIEEYAALCPARGDEIRELFPAIVLMERSKARRRRSPDGQASLGAGRPERLGDFRIVREIGRGGMGIVYEAEQESLGRKVAVKVLPRSSLLAPRELERFRREARTVARLHHTHIVPVFGVGEQDGLHYFVMQLIPGVGLDEVLRLLGSPGEASQETGDRQQLTTEVVRALFAEPSQPGPVAGVAARAASFHPSPGADYWRQVARIGIQVAEALQEAHGQGILHRDVKPANLLMTPQGQVWVSDFGLAKVLEAEGVTGSGDMVGTLPYMAPELFRGQCDQRSDVYSLGLTLYELLTLRPAFRDADRAHLIRLISEGALARPRQFQPAIPRDLETVVLKAVAVAPTHRYASAADLAGDLRLFLEGKPVRARRVSALGRGWRWVLRNPLMASLVGLVVVLLLAVTGVSTTGYVRTRRALEGESQQRQRAEATAVTALEALDRTFTRFAPRHAGTPAGVALEGPEGELLDVSNQPVVSRETAAFLEEMLGYYDRLAQQGAENVRLREAAARANLRIGDLHQRLGRPESALAAYERALAAYQEIDRQEEGGTQVVLALIHNERGKVYRLLQKTEEARQEHEEALRLLEGDPAIEQVPEARFELARTCYLLGQRSRRDLAVSLPWDFRGRSRPPGPPPGLPRNLAPPRPTPEQGHLSRAEALLSELHALYPAVPAYRQMLACCLRERSPGLTSAGRQRAIEILEKLVAEFPGAPEYLHELSETCSDFDVRRPPFDSDFDGQAERQLRKALAVSEKLSASRPGVPQYATTQVQIRQKLAVVLARKSERLAEAEQQLRRALDLQEVLAREHADIRSHRVWLAVLRQSLASVRAQKGEADGCQLLEQAAADLEEVLKTQPESKQLEPLLAESYFRLAREYGRLGDRQRETEALRSAEKYGRRGGPPHRFGPPPWRRPPA